MHWILISLLILLSACAQKEVRGTWTQQVVGRSGYLSVPPILEEKEGFDHPKRFDACEPVKVTKVFKRPGSDSYKISLQQGKRSFLTSGLGNRRYLAEDPGKDPRQTNEVVGMIRYHIKKELPFNPKTPKTVNNESSTMRELMCQNKAIWNGMSEELFYFVMGYPREVNIVGSGDRTSKQMIYPASKYISSRKHIYLFVDGELAGSQ